MTIIGLLIVLVVIGLVLYLVGTLPIDQTVKTIIYVIAVIAICIYLLKFAGLA